MMKIRTLSLCVGVEVGAAFPSVKGKEKEVAKGTRKMVTTRWKG
jgi:hypothetical protein